jgi:transcriptional regulator with XRE-family HTH domain
MLRERLGDTQQEFAVRLGIALASVARYETSRPPSGQALLTFEDLARQNGLLELAALFRRGPTGPDAEMENPENLVWAGVARELSRNRHLLSAWPAVAEALVDGMSELVRTARTGTRVKGPYGDPDTNAEYFQTWLDDVQCSNEGAEELLQRLVDERQRSTPQESPAEARQAVLKSHPRIEIRYHRQQADRIVESLAARLKAEGRLPTPVRAPVKKRVSSGRKEK